jgi:hypothetical protein
MMALSFVLVERISGKRAVSDFFSASARSESSLDDFLQRNPPRGLDQLVQLQVLPGQLSECVENKSKT